MKKELLQHMAEFGAIMLALVLLATACLALGESPSRLALVLPILLGLVLILAGMSGATCLANQVGGTGSKVFSLETWNPRALTNQTSSYTAALTDEQINMNGSNLTLTLPLISTLQGSVAPQKTYGITNKATTPLTVVPSTTVDTILNALNTINKLTTFTVYPNETIVITANAGDGDWQIVSPFPVPALKRVPFVLAVTTSGTGSVNVIDADGAPVNMFISAVLTIALDTNAGNITVTNGTNTVVTIAKSTTAALPVGGTSYANQAVPKGNILTVQSSTTNGNAIVIITGTMQQYA